MKVQVTAATLGLILSIGRPIAAAAEASPAEVAQLREELMTLLMRVEKLEQALASAGAPAAAPAAAVAPPEQQPAPAPASSSTADWTRNIRWKGDFRYRHEQFDIEGVAQDRTRHRIRARLGMDARITPTLTAGFQIASGDLADPRSTNSTLDEASRRKQFELDLAYVDWHPRADLLVTLGKQRMPWFKTANSMLFDSDLNPEGMALQYGGTGGAFAKAWGYWLNEESAAADASLIGAQAGYAFGNGLTVAAGYWDYGAIERHPVLGFAGAPAGNDTFLAGAGCTGAGTTLCYAHDYNIAIADLQWSGSLGARPLTLFGSYLENLDPDELNTGYSLGFLYGRTAEAGSWEVGALYQDIERDAQFALFFESDFADGMTQGRGVFLQGAWVPVRNVTLKAGWFINERSYGTPSEADYERMQLDLNYRF